MFVATIAGFLLIVGLILHKRGWKFVDEGHEEKMQRRALRAYLSSGY